MSPEIRATVLAEQGRLDDVPAAGPVLPTL